MKNVINGKRKKFFMQLISKSKTTGFLHLDFEKTNYEKEFDIVFELYHLTSLTISNFKGSFISESLGNLINLKKLTFENCLLEKIPDSVGNLGSLQEFFFRMNHFTKIESKLHSLPITFGKLKNLTKLDLSDAKLTSLPESMNELINLKSLSLYENCLKEFPKCIKYMKKLEYLNLNGNNEIKDIPDYLSELISLKNLAIGPIGLDRFPVVVTKLENLEGLYLQSNNIKLIPEDIGKLINLTELSLHGNKIIKLPENIGKLVNLTELFIQGNQIESLPESMKSLKKLREFSFENNKFNIPPEVEKLQITEVINEILKYQKAKKAGTLEPIHEAKVIFIGESNYGKTHLIELLQKGEIKRTINTTHGIERNNISIPYKGKDIKLNIWDLGGQEFMRSTHQFFFSERTLYVLVTLARRERKELNHWLQLANQLGNKAPVLIVINKVDIDSHDLDRKSLQRDYPNIIDFVRTSINDCQETDCTKSLSELKNKIESIITNENLMPSVFEKRSSEWFRVKDVLEKLEQKGKDFITYEEYEELDFIKNLPKDERKINLKLLSMIGSVVSFVDDPRLLDTNVINPQWIMDGVYAIINDSLVKDTFKGKLCINDLERILQADKFPKSRHIYLLELMKKFNLCYELKDQNGVFYIPDLFEDIEPTFDWNEESDLMHFRYDYDDFSPDSFMTKFIVEMHHDIIDENRWRSGIYISNGTCQAKVYQSYSKNYINIEIKGNNQEKRNYLYSIREVFRKLHTPFPNMKITKELKYKGYWIDFTKLSKFEEKNKSYYHEELDEEIPVTDILNGYTSIYERRGDLKKIKIFLASSEELKDDREQFEIFINRENNKLVDKGIFLKLEIWEDFIDAISQTRLQDEYNFVVKNCDIFVSLFFTKVGKFTEEEFEKAFSQFKANGKPLIYTYFKNADISTGNINESIKTLLDFQNKLKELGHFKTNYKNIEDLKLQFKNQLDKLITI